MKSGLRIAVALAAATGTTATAYAFADPARNAHEVVCKQSTQAASRFRHRLCFTRAQWDRIAESSKRAFGEMVNRPSIETRK